MAKAVVQHAEDDEGLTPQVRKALLAPIVGGIAAINELVAGPGTARDDRAREPLRARERHEFDARLRRA